MSETTAQPCDQILACGGVSPVGAVVAVGAAAVGGATRRCSKGQMLTRPVPRRQTCWVTARASSGWTDLTIEHIEELDGEDFERFCNDIIAFEAYGRHDGPRVDGSAGHSTADGGRDILLTVRRAPALTRLTYQQRHHVSPLTEDALGRTAYSCKSGGNWLDLALADAKKERADLYRPAEVLLEGGHFKLLINTFGRLDASVTRGKVARTPEAHLAQALWEHLKRIDPLAPDPSARIEIIEGPKLVEFLRGTAPEGAALQYWLERFQLGPVLHSIDEWRELHRTEREEPAYVFDETRAVLRDEIVAFVADSHSPTTPKVALVVGAPGIGKTRAVIEALLSDPRAAQRVRVAFDAQQAREAIEQRQALARHPNAILIVDDCPPESVDSLATLLRVAAQSKPAARMLIICPASRAAFEQAKVEPRWFVDRMLEETVHALARVELGPAADPGALHDLAVISERYPWFAILIAREARAQGAAPRDLREAVRWALASRSERASEHELEALRLRRARCLLAVSLTSRFDWSAMSDAEHSAIASAVGLARWEEVLESAKECVRRGLLRKNLGWHYKYVTPLILEREVITWLFDPNDGTDPGGRTLSRHGQAWLPDFFQRLQRLGLPANSVKGLVEAMREDIERAPESWDEMRAMGLLGQRLRFLAQHEPTATASLLRRRVEASSLDTLDAQSTSLNGVAYVLDELAEHDGAFADVEATLLRLALATSRRPDLASRWQGLFAATGRSQRTIYERIELLRRRTQDHSAQTRLLALEGVRDAIHYPASSEAYVRVWEMLVARFADDDGPVAARAKHLAIDELRGAVRHGLGEAVLPLIASQAERLDDDERVRMLDALSSVRAYDDGYVGLGRDALQQLEALLRPMTFSQRLHAEVGAWGPASLRAVHQAKDDVLAEEGLSGEAPILGELDWLVSESAKRGTGFLYTLGRHDVRGVLQAELTSRATTPAWRRLLARYLAGHVDAGRVDTVDDALRAMLRLPGAEPTVAVAVAAIGANDERLGWIERALATGQLEEGTLAALMGRGWWLKDVTDDRVAAFVASLLAKDLTVSAALALEIIVERIEGRPTTLPLFRESLYQALERLSPHPLDGMVEHYWELGSLALVEAGDLDRGAHLAVTALARSIGSHHHGWAVLHAVYARAPDVAWRSVEAALSRNDAGSGNLVLAFHFHAASIAWPADAVLRWVGSDPQRARRIAQIVRPRSDEFDPILRELLRRFGPRGMVASTIMGRIFSTEHAVSSLAAHDSEQLSRARHWLGDSEPSVRLFAKELVDSLERSFEANTAAEEDERRRWGT